MLLAALPATPVQLVHACYQAGYEVVVPASWGDELVAQAVLEDLQYRGRDPVIQCTCPHVRERLLASGKHLLPSMVQTAAPPVAAARYVRAAFSPRAVHITYLGACPGARSTAIDERYMPNDFLHDLTERGIVLADMPAVFDSVLPPDRRRNFSLPGGCPSQEALWQATEGRMLREVTQPTFATDLAQTLVWREHVMIDVATSLGCACSGSLHQVGPRCGRVAIMALEPPRADQPVVVYHPEFAAQDPEPSAPQSRNGDGLPSQPPSPAPDDAPAWAHEPSVEPPAVGTRTKKGARLPRAYLAKRRHAVGYVPEPEDIAEEVTQTAETGPTPERAVAPNEPEEVALPIEVHIEPEAQNEFAPPQEEGEDVEIIAVDLALAATIEEVAEQEVRAETAPEPALVDLAEPESPAAEEPVISGEAPATEAAAEPPAVEHAVQVDEPPPPEPLPDVPLRVEVEIDEEGIEPSAMAAAEPEVVGVEIPEAPIEPAREVTRSRSWGDLLIAIWLVLVASAVIASLLWRR